MKYEKPFLTFEEQVDKLISRGMAVTNPEQAAKTLAHIGYYRLSAYWYHWRLEPEDGVPQERYSHNARFEDSVRLYDFDRELRLVLLDAIERVEVALRVAIANVAG